ncbi:MAG: hypothetical protein H6611_09200 [Ignavibacteriales bacterium]|nr:hypothetical protein [Ignavibacteriales bacterium]
MKKNLIIKLTIIHLLFAVNISTAQKFLKVDNLKSAFTKKENKNKYYEDLIKNIKSTLNLPFDKNYDNWNEAIKDAESIFFNESIIKNSLQELFNQKIDKKIKFQRTALEAANTLFEADFSESINNIFEITGDKISLAVSIHYLMKNNFNQRSSSFYINEIKNRFNDYDSDPLLTNLVYDLENPDSKKFVNYPNLADLFENPFQKGKTIIYSIQRKNREFIGLTIIKKPDGTFVKKDDGTIFNIPQLAVSYSNLPAYIPNGNTPEGIYSIIGIYISPTETIGPTPNVLIRSPFEVSPSIFYHKNNVKNNWDIEDYKNLLPKSWLNYFPIYQSFYAGKIGRKLIIMHGSTDELKYFSNKPYYPLTSTRGCLSSKEIWDAETGKCLESDQVKLINAFSSTKQKKGFLIVLEINDKQENITLEEILPYIKNGPRR